MSESPEIAVLIPCRNEAATVAKVIDDFRRQLPSATVYVFDNASTDGTAEIAAAHGATVVPVPRAGKGNVVERMFADVAADYYVMVDGDDTYPAERVRDLLAPVVAGDADMVVGARLSGSPSGTFPQFHRAGNRVLTGLINWLFDAALTDMMSGYRVFNRRVVERVPVVSAGFEIETEMTVQLMYYRLTIAEIDVAYRSRPEGSESKLHTVTDGFAVLWAIFTLLRAIKPLTFFGLLGLAFFASAFVAPHPTLQTAAVIIAFGMVFLGVLLHAINWRFKELHNVTLRRVHRRGPSE